MKSDKLRVTSRTRKETLWLKYKKAATRKVEKASRRK
ncbi:hypothetical protein BACUNI_02458 [Bacteroides uniformis ATCC 8492]|uniref:Uncharacterized protein n=1 Tax=Bacteroides uniformis (strain ATCC 8492 / DSM 6597 / CCUG 4942 / CIP 103695 / JCM 5828 / KCTC 5204 / NCTC 13054 / VPI 0061) TaxID=411479 RepID=A0ABC9NAU0_BACUC|nr:hypothetical protein BACUNI_02458 [Bacteroides uniformis ATCC 8492]